jgi:NDP-4-keto-2,6-dideoxyhexose 3-C-methyltransferase
VHYKTRDTCRACSGDLVEILDLGMIAMSDFVTADTTEVIKAPLTLVRCTQCDLVQLKDTINQDEMYRQYWYQSGFNKTMIQWLRELKDQALSFVTLEPGDTVIDIGANDGTFLGFFDKDINRVGVDPAKNLREVAEQQCDLFINDYFTYQSEVPKAKLITSIAMFYDLEDPGQFVEDIKKQLTEDGIWVIQMMDLLSMFKTNAFDNICHEHLEYYSLHALSTLLKKHGLEIFHAEHNEVNGGSIRVVVSWPDSGRTINASVQELLNLEDEYFGSFEDPFQAFNERIGVLKDTVVNFIKDINAKGDKIYVMGASTKGNTLLQYFGLDYTNIPYAAEVSKDKFGKTTVASNIPIIAEYRALKLNPKYFLILPWTFTETFRRIHKDYLDRGGKFLVPCPEPTLITKDGDILL